MKASTRVWHIAFIVLGSTCLPINFAYAIDGASFSVRAANELRAARLALKWDWQRQPWEFRGLTIDGYWDVSGIYWNNPNLSGSAYGVSASPVFRFTPRNTKWLGGYPFGELGVGVAVLGGTNIPNGTPRGRRMGSRFQFENRLVLGLTFSEQLELAYQFLHHSNGDLASDNNGIDTHLFRIAWKLSGK